MIKEGTLFILGAGASHYFGFPTGQELIDILTDPNDEERIWQIIRDLNGNKNDEIAEFTHALHYSSRPSIDSLLTHRPEFLQIGKWAIACALIRRENHHRLFTTSITREGKTECNWYKVLHKMIDRPLEEWPRTKLNVITFNYDLSLEAYLHTSLTTTFPSRQKDVKAALKSITIVHVHGHLGALPHQDELDIEKREYGNTNKPNDILNAAKSLAIVSETDRNAPQLKMARKMISEAKQIIFLGFGYLEENMKLLGAPFNEPNKFMLGSCYGLTPSEIDHIGRNFRQMTTLKNPEFDCYHFLRNHYATLVA